MYQRAGRGDASFGSEGSSGGGEGAAAEDRSGAQGILDKISSAPMCLLRLLTK